MIIVCGPGRCGTSTVAKWLIGLGIDMGRRFSPPQQANPEGTFEDLDFKWPNDLFLNRCLTERQWRLLIDDAISQRRAPWGFKDPRVCHLISDYAVYQPFWVRVRRDNKEVVDSMVRAYGWDRDYAIQLTIFRERELDRINAFDVEFPDIVSGAAFNQLKEITDGFGCNQGHAHQVVPS